MNKILDGSATEAGIVFSVEKVTAVIVKSYTWDRVLLGYTKTQGNAKTNSGTA